MACTHNYQGPVLLSESRNIMKLIVTGYPLHRENRKNGKKNRCWGKHREIGNFAKSQGIWFAQVVNSLILKVKDILIFATKISYFF